MENYFYFEKKLNWKKVLIISIIVILIIGIIIFLFVNSKKNIVPSIPIKSDGISSFTDTTNSFNISLPEKYSLTKFDSNTNHVLELKSSNILYIAFAKKDLSSSWFSETDLIQKDKEQYISSFENTFNVSEIASYSLNSLQIFSYTFEYTYSEKPYCSEVFWVKNNSEYYVIDINYLKDSQEQYSELSQYILNNLKFIN